MTKTEELCTAIINRNVSEMRRLITEMTNIEINARYKFDTTNQNQRYSLITNGKRYFVGTALHIACLVNNVTAVEELLGLDDIDPTYEGFPSGVGECTLDNDYYTPLKVALAMKHKDSFEFLIQDARTTVDLKAVDVADFLALLKDINRDNRDTLILILSAIQKNYEVLKDHCDAIKDQFAADLAASKDQIAAVQEELTSSIVTVTNSDMLRSTDLEVLKIHENNYEKLLENGQMTDFRIICGEETFHCHKNILFAQSNVLQAMFNNDMKESREDSMTITDLEPVIVDLLLKFIYTGTVDSNEIEINSLELLEAADRYELDGLTKLCENELMDHIDNDTVLEMIMKADMYHADRLKEEAMNWIVENKFEIVKQEGWKEVLIKFPRLMADMLEAFTTDPTDNEDDTEVEIITEIDILKSHESNFEKLLERGDMSDFSIICGEETFNCHKNILFSQSSVLRTMFSNDIGESTKNSMVTNDLEPVIVKLLLKFIYTGTIGEEEAKQYGTKILQVADRYKLDGLTKLCENELMPMIDNNNVLEMIVKADLYHADKLRKYAMKWIVANKAEIVEQEGWKELLLKFPILVDMLEVLTKKF